MWGSARENWSVKNHAKHILLIEESTINTVFMHWLALCIYVYHNNFSIIKSSKQAFFDTPRIFPQQKLKQNRVNDKKKCRKSKGLLKSNFKSYHHSIPVTAFDSQSWSSHKPHYQIKSWLVDCFFPFFFCPFLQKINTQLHAESRQPKLPQPKQWRNRN